MNYEYWFASIKKISNQKKINMKKIISSAKEIYYIEEKDLRKRFLLSEEECFQIIQSKKEWNVDKKYEDLMRKDIRIIPYDCEEYPPRLKTIYQAPYALFVKGNLPSPKSRTVAIVGARKCTPYGESCAMKFAAKLSEYGAEIISGLANGIDGMGQRAAINQKGRTFAVLGSGVDICYPRNHIGLYLDILEHEGGILSEFIPGTKPFSWNFPLRNRIISGLSDVVLVIEAKKKSGSLITADLAIEQGKDVYALPGPVTSPFSQGCNWLIKQGAGVLLTPEELIEDLKLSRGSDWEVLKQKTDEKQIMLESIEELVYSCLDFDSKNVDTICRKVKLPTYQVLNILITLELKGLVKEVSKNNYVKL